MKKLRTVCFILLAVLIIVNIDLGRNYLLATDPALNDGITCRSLVQITGVFEPFGDHWSLAQFRRAFEHSLLWTGAALVVNVALWDKLYPRKDT